MINHIKNILFFAMLSFVLWGCGGKPDKSPSHKPDKLPSNSNEPPREDSIEFTLTFAQDDKNSLHQALARESKKLKPLESKINGIFNKMGLALKIQGLLLTDKLLAAFKSADDKQNFQTIGLVEGENSAPFLLRRLVAPGLTQEQIKNLSRISACAELACVNNDYAIPSKSDESGAKSLLTYKIKVPFRTLLGDLFFVNSFHFFSDEVAVPLIDALGSRDCQDIKNQLTKFVNDNFNDLGKISNIVCSKDQQKKELNLAFNVDGKSVNIRNRIEVIYVRGEIIRELLLMRFDSLSK